ALGTAPRRVDGDPARPEHPAGAGRDGRAEVPRRRPADAGHGHPRPRPDVRDPRPGGDLPRHRLPVRRLDLARRRPAAARRTDRAAAPADRAARARPQARPTCYAPRTGPPAGLRKTMELYLALTALLCLVALAVTVPLSR